MNEKVKKWIKGTAGLPPRLLALYEKGAIREITPSDSGRLGVVAIYIPTYTGGTKKYRKRRIRGALGYVTIDIGNVDKRFADIWIRITEDPSLANTPHRIRLDTGHILLIDSIRYQIEEKLGEKL